MLCYAKFVPANRTCMLLTLLFQTVIGYAKALLYHSQNCAEWFLNSSGKAPAEYTFILSTSTSVVQRVI